jgi:O-antigen/teichoic acid export membrane protein
VGLATNALFLLPIVHRVTFPTYARLQHDPAALKLAIEHSIKWVAATVIPTTLLLAALGHQIVEHVYGPKWLLGLPSFYLLCIPMINACYSTVMVSALYGLGRAKTVLRLTLIWAAAGWALGVPLTLVFHQHGFALAMSVVSWLSILSVRELNKVVKVRFVPELLRITGLAAIPAAIIAVFAHLVVHSAIEVVAVGAGGALSYLILMYGFGELDELKDLVRHGRRAPSPPHAPAAAAPVEEATQHA